MGQTTERGKAWEITLGEGAKFLSPAEQEKIVADVREKLGGGLLRLLREGYAYGAQMDGVVKCGYDEHHGERKWYLMVRGNRNFCTWTTAVELVREGDRPEIGVNRWSGFELDSLRKRILAAKDAHKQAMIEGWLDSRRKSYVQFGLAESKADVPPLSQEELIRLCLEMTDAGRKPEGADGETGEDEFQDPLADS